MNQSDTDKLVYLCGLAVINLIVFMVVASFIGGDASNGHEEAGRYFLGSHGKLTETTHAVFLYSRIHGVITLIGGIGAIFIGGVYALSKRA